MLCRVFKNLAIKKVMNMIKCLLLCREKLLKLIGVPRKNLESLSMPPAKKGWEYLALDVIYYYESFVKTKQH